MRSFLNEYLGIPLIGLLRGWVLNFIIGNCPIMPLRDWYYRNFCKIKIGRNTSIWRGAKIWGKFMNDITIGDNCMIAYESYWVAGAPITLGNYVVFGHGVQVFTSDHDPDAPDFVQRDAPIVIEDYAFIGSRAMILPGVTIGKGAVVAACAVVTKDVAPYTIVGGQPARFLRDRKVEEINFHVEKSPWWV